MNAVVFSSPVATMNVVVGRRGIHLPSLDATWWAEWMVVQKGRRVELRYNRDDLRVATCYDLEGRLIGSAHLRMACGDPVETVAEVVA